MIETSTDQSDVVWGAASMAPIINKTERATFHLLEKGQIPARKVGNQWVSTRRKLLAFIEGGE